MERLANGATEVEDVERAHSADEMGDKEDGVNRLPSSPSNSWSSLTTQQSTEAEGESPGGEGGDSRCAAENQANARLRSLNFNWVGRLASHSARSALVWPACARSTPTPVLYDDA